MRASIRCLRQRATPVPGQHQHPGYATAAYRGSLISPSASCAFICPEFFTRKEVLRNLHVPSCQLNILSQSRSRGKGILCFRNHSRPLSLVPLSTTTIILTLELLNILPLCHYALHMYISWTSKVKLERNKECELISSRNFQHGQPLLSCIQ